MSSTVFREMLTAVYTNHLSLGKRLASTLGESKDENPLASSHAFYRDGIQVGGMYNYMSGPSRIEVKSGHYLFRRKNFVVFFTQYYMLERDAQTLATAKESLRFLGSNSKITSAFEPPIADLTVRCTTSNMRGSEYSVTEGREEIGAILHDTNFGADIDLSLRIPLALQIFIFRVSFNMTHRGR
jgi:hypothetical protein